MRNSIHIPVLRSEVLSLLSAVEPPRILDGTIGMGGHSEALLEERKDLRIIGIDRDREALDCATERLARFGDRVSLFRADFAEVGGLLDTDGTGGLGGVLLDLGLSSLQLDRADRGFSLRRNGPLDMRMDREHGVSALTWLAEVSEEDLRRVLQRFGEERYARRIARSIVRARVREPIRTTEDLRGIVHRSVPRQAFRGSIDPATRTFQAIRIQVNRELESLERGLVELFAALSPGGVLVVISFHSLEDRIVKRFFLARAADCICPPDLPECRCGKRVEAKILTRKPWTPTDLEVAENPRARSAKLRAARKTG